MDRELIEWVGEFKPDQRFTDLCDRLALYYQQTPWEMSNKTAYKYLREFKKWCKERGYTQEEINKAKRARLYEH